MVRTLNLPREHRIGRKRLLDTYLAATLLDHGIQARGYARIVKTKGMAHLEIPAKVLSGLQNVTVILFMSTCGW